ncbi:mycofactocin dehydrogenase MftG [Streptomyces sp. NBC_00483]|uniref:mycofactocin dehydrogenase MftG n=1 Tax=Streptomyces sp. NBC_00483 TaxID=2975756 RepID=UPI002E17F6DB
MGPIASARPDVLVVGAGGAGAVLAARLSEDVGRNVLLVEAGPVPAAFDPDLLDARLVPGARPDHPATRSHAVRLTPQRPWSVPRGRVLGGSTTVNGGYFVRARREDFTRWAGAGNPAWAYERVLPLLRALEDDLDFGRGEVHGVGGPIPVTRGQPTRPAAVAFREAARGLGFASEPDKNDQGPPGFGPVPSNSVDGVRWNTGLAYLPTPVQDRPNLTVLGDCSVRRVVVERGRATGVEVERDGARETLDAGCVVLCAGALVTPHLLLLSGIGPRADLERAGVPVVRDAPAVGARLSDHPQLLLDWQPRDDLGPPATGWLGDCLHLNSPGGPPGCPGDIEILQSLVPMAGLVGGTARVPGAPHSFLASVQTPRPTGRLRLLSADPEVPPAIDYDYLRDGEVLRRLRAAVRVTAELLDTTPFTEVSDGGLLAPGYEALREDRALDAWIRDHLGTAQHTCGTVPMGPAVDQYGRVHGIRGLRVADTSILPDTPHRGPAATAVLIGELIADAMRRELP